MLPEVGVYIKCLSLKLDAYVHCTLYIWQTANVRVADVHTHAKVSVAVVPQKCFQCETSSLITRLSFLPNGTKTTVALK